MTERKRGAFYSKAARGSIPAGGLPVYKIFRSSLRCEITALTRYAGGSGATLRLNQIQSMPAAFAPATSEPS